MFKLPNWGFGFKPIPSVWRTVAAEIASSAASSTSETGLWQGLNASPDQTPAQHRQTTLYSEISRQLNLGLYKPQAVSGTKANFFHSKNEDYYILKSPAKEYIRLYPEDYFLWQQLDGQHNVQQILALYYQEYKIFGFNRLNHLLESLKTKGFLTDPPVVLYQDLEQRVSRSKVARLGEKFRRTFMSFEIPVINMERTSSWLYKHFAWIFFTRPFQLVFLVTALVGLAVFLLLFNNQTFSVVDLQKSLGHNILSLMVAYYLAIVLHEFAHALTTKHFGAEVRKGGVMLFYGMLAFYVDTMDAWMTSRKGRVLVSWAGPYMNFIVGGSVTIASLFVQPEIGVLLYRLAFMCYMGAIFNLNVLIELDGYFMLMDWLDIPRLRVRAMQFVTTKMFQKLWRRERFKREELIFSIFGVAATFYMAFFLFSFITILQRNLSHWFNQIITDNDIGGKVSAAFLAFSFGLPFTLGLGTALYGRIRRAISSIQRRGIFGASRNSSIGLLLLVIFWPLFRPDDTNLLVTLLPVSLTLYLGVHLRRRTLLYNYGLLWAVLPMALTSAIVESLLHFQVLNQAEGLAGRLLIVMTASLLVLGQGWRATFELNDWRLKLVFWVGPVLVVGVSLIAGNYWYQNGETERGLVLTLVLAVFVSLTSLLWFLPVVFERMATQLRYSYIFLMFNLVCLAGVTLGYAFLGLSEGWANVLFMEAYGWLVAALLLYRQAYRSVLQIRMRLNERNGLRDILRMRRAANFLVFSVLDIFKEAFGERLARQVRDQLNQFALYAELGLRVDPQNNVQESELRQDLALISIAAQYRQLLDQLLIIISRLGSEVFGRGMLQRSYDALPWEEREIADEYLLVNSGYSHWLHDRVMAGLEERQHLLASISLFHDCTASELHRLAVASSTRRYRNKQVIIREGERGNYFYIVKSGKVMVWQQDGEGLQQLVNQHERGGFFGEVALLSDRPRNATCIAAGDTELLMLRRQDFYRLVRGHFELAERISQNLRRVQLLQQTSLFAEIPLGRLKEIVGYLHEEDYEPQQEIIRQNEIGDRFYIIEDGEVEVLTQSTKGHEVVLSYRRKGEYFGEVALLNNIPRTATIRTTRFSRLLSLSRADFLELLGHDLEVKNTLERVSSRRLASVEYQPNRISV